MGDGNRTLFHPTCATDAASNIAEERSMSNDYSGITGVIKILHDGEKGFADIGEHLQSHDLKVYFIQEAQHRGAFARELEAEVSDVTGQTFEAGSTASGTLHRLWGDLKANVGGGDHTLLETAEQGEDAAVKAYIEAIAAESPSPALHDMLRRQQVHIQASHDRVKALRDGLIAVS
jgi:uncharacterized protein (TIGR02284 family)